PLRRIYLRSVEPLFDFKQAQVIEWTRTHLPIIPLYGRAEKTGFAALAERPGKAAVQANYAGSVGTFERAGLASSSGLEALHATKPDAVALSGGYLGVAKRGVKP